MDNKKISLKTLCDLSKAFDSVNHEILMQKISKLKVDSFCFRHYLQVKIQTVKINTILSKTAPVNFGVPQGSILRPILFTIFVNDLTEMIHDCEVVQYADDTQLYTVAQPMICLNSSEEPKILYLSPKHTLTETAL